MLMAFPRARAHAFFYICACVDLLTAAAGPAERLGVDGLCQQIAGMQWDYGEIHGLLFAANTRFSHAQAWALALAMVRCFRATRRARTLAFMTVSRRSDSPVHCLSDDLLRAIGRLVLND